MTYKVFGDVDEKAVAQLENVLRDERAVDGAIMADGHLGYSMPIGGVVRYADAISPTGVGFDIACGNMAVKTDLVVPDLVNNFEGFDDTPPSWIYDAMKGFMREIQQRVAFGMGRSNPEPVDHKLFDSPVWLWLEAQKKGLKQKSQQQLGTVGSGNHYVDILADEEGYIWTANHFGSRGLGHTIASGFMAMAAGVSFEDRVPEGEDAVVFDTDSEIGAHYLACMALAGEYAYAGREFVTQQVLGIFGAKAVETVHNHHNFAWKEEGLWVVRKGATPLLQVPAFIGGSMGDNSVIVKGKTSNHYFGGSGDGFPFVHDIGNLGSAPHGAGRVMSRTKAAGKMRTARTDEGKKYRYRDTSTAAIDWNAVRGSLINSGIVVYGAGADEAPGVYKSLQDVLGYHENIEVVHTLRPLGVVMAGPDEFDPYKD